MLRKSLTFIAVVALTITLKPTSITAQRNGQPQSAARQADSSQPPTPTERLASQGQENQATAERQPPTQNQGPTSVSGGVTITVNNQAVPAPANDNQRNQSEQAQYRPPFSWWPIGIPVGSLTDLIIAAATIAIVFVTYWMWEVSNLQRKTLVETLAANKIVERAYIAMSNHPQVWPLQPDTPVPVRIVIKNHGRTPGEIINFIVRFCVVYGPLPADPIYDDAGPEAHVVLMSQEPMNFLPPTFTLSAPDVAAIQGGNATLYLIGYVDYLDRFGDRHRGGYARCYTPSTVGDNFSFVVQPGYNYDIEIDEQGRPKPKKQP